MSGPRVPPCLAVATVRALVLTACLGSCMQSVAANDETRERERIVAERALVRADFAAQQRECQTRFAVTGCVDAARGRQREALGRLRRQELLLDDARRRQRAAERVAEIRGRVGADEARERKALAVSTSTATPASASASASAPNSATTSGAESAQRAPAPRVRSRKAGPREADHVAPDAATQRRDNVKRQAREARNAAEFEARREAARAHRDEVERRNTERAAHGKKAAPLPAGASGS